MRPDYDEREAIYQQGPRQIYKAQVTRRPYRRGFRYGLLLVLAAVAVWYLVKLPDVAGGGFPWLSPRWQGIILGVGNMVAGLLVMVGAARLTWNMILMIRRKPERVIFYDAGFVWEIRGERHKYGWNAIKAVLEDPNAWFFRGKSRFQWGHVTFKMRDGASYRFTPAHGDLIGFLQTVRPYYADELGARMGQQLRMNKSFRIHPRLVVRPAGLVLDKKQAIPWEKLRMEVTGRHLILNQATAGGVERVERLPLKKISNLAGFMELAESTMETFQRPNPYAKR